MANVPNDMTAISEDFSRLDAKHTHGKNSLVSKFLNEDNPDIYDGYMGPYPPDKDHVYTLTVYALDCELPLENGFYRTCLGKRGARFSREILKLTRSEHAAFNLA